MTLLTVLISLMVPSSWALNCAETPADIQAYMDTKKLDCELRDIAQKINEQKSTVPAYLFHFGKKEFLDEDIKEGNIPQKAWDDFIVGEKTRFPLEKSRRGLYGSAGIDANMFGSSIYNWMMIIEINESCRNPESVNSFFDMEKTDRFKQWFGSRSTEEKANFASPDDFAKICFPKGVSQVSYKGFSDTRCEQIVDLYFKDTKTKIVQDHVITKAFYIRDRSCIKNIKGTPEDIIKIALQNDLMWITPCGDYNAGIDSFMRVLIQALKLSPENLSLNQIDQLIDRAKVAHVDTEKLLAYRRCLALKKLDVFRQTNSLDMDQRLCSGG